MQILVEKKFVKAGDKELAEELGYSTKTLGRYLEELTLLYPHIITLKKGKNKVYELVDVSYVFEKIMTNRDDLYWFFDLLERWDSNIFSDFEYKVSKKDKDVFLYKNSPFEELEELKQKETFSTLRKAIIHRQYVDIDYVYDKKRIHKRAIPLKLIFMEQNWYVAIVDEEIGIRFLRIFFIQQVKVISNSSYMGDLTNETLLKYHDFFKSFQNPMSRFDKNKKIAKLKASPKIAKYFKADMKRHFHSEEFVEQCEDGSVIFSVGFTQSIEILPFVKKWLPDIKILSPESLEKKLCNDLKSYLL